jgi:hypothetical protein
MDFTEIAKQAPGIAGVIIIVIVFLQAQAKRDAAFLEAQASRDRLFMEAMKANSEAVAKIATEVNQNTEILIAHNAEMRVTAAAVLRGQRTTPPKTRKVVR